MTACNPKKRWGVILGIIMLAIVAAGYAIGDYFVDYAMKRGDEADPSAPPAACASIHDKTRKIPAMPTSPVTSCVKLWALDCASALKTPASTLPPATARTSRLPRAEPSVSPKRATLTATTA